MLMNTTRIPKKITTYDCPFAGDETPAVVRVEHFDSCGRLTLEEMPGTEECSARVDRIEHYRDPEGLEVEVREYRVGSLFRRKVNEFDDEGGELGFTEYDADGFKVCDESIDWSHSGRVAHVKRTEYARYLAPRTSRQVRYYHKDGKIAFISEEGGLTKYCYNPEGRLVREDMSHKGENGEVIMDLVFDYNSSGDPCLMKCYEDGECVSTHETEYEYDGNGLWIRSYLADAHDYRREIEYY